MSPLLAGFFVLAACVAFIVLAYVRGWGWTGFTPGRAAEPGDATERSARTLWDWLQLLIIPLGIAVVVFALNLAQSGRDQRREDRQAGRERSIAADGRREDALRGYLQQMSELLLHRKLLRSPRGSEVRSVARILTLTVLRRLDGERKGFVLWFLTDAKLIDRKDPKVDLSRADLRGATLRGGPPLAEVDLSRADLRSADFRSLVLLHVNFHQADLRGASFRDAFLSWPDSPQSHLVGTDLRGTDFSGAYLNGVDFLFSCLTGSRFVGAYLDRASFRNAEGEDVDFSRATLDGADFRGAKLVDVTLAGASVTTTAFPDGWRSNGLALPPGETESLCREFAATP